MKIGFDLHGVLDNPKVSPFFSIISRLLIDEGHEIHIITGAEDTPTLRDELRRSGVKWTHIFSITDYHKELGTPIIRDELGRPWMDPEIWNPAKGEYAMRVGIDIHFDDSFTYGKFFQTTYCCVMNG